MRPVEQRLQPAVLLLLLLLPVGQAWSATLFLHDPYPQLCITSEGAQYRVDDGSLQPSQGLFSLFPPDEKPLQPRLKIPPAAQPGELLRLYVTAIDPLDSVTVEVSTPGTHELTHGIGFRSRLDAGGEQWSVLLGIPSNAVVQQGYPDAPNFGGVPKLHIPSAPRHTRAVLLFRAHPAERRPDGIAYDSRSAEGRRIQGSPARSHQPSP